jgi:hypothetical protein
MENVRIPNYSDKIRNVCVRNISRNALQLPLPLHFLPLLPFSCPYSFPLTLFLTLSVTLLSHSFSVFYSILFLVPSIPHFLYLTLHFLPFTRYLASPSFLITLFLLPPFFLSLLLHCLILNHSLPFQSLTLPSSLSSRFPPNHHHTYATHEVTQTDTFAQLFIQNVLDSLSLFSTRSNVARTFKLLPVASHWLRVQDL